MSFQLFLISFGETP